MAHYTKDELELFRHGQMSLLGKISCSSHLKCCPECARLLRELEEDDRLIAEIRSSVELYRDLARPVPAAHPSK